MFSKMSLPLGLHLREMQPQDHIFIETLFSSSREHLYQMPMAKSQVDLLIKQQFILQQTSYANAFPAAQTLIIQLFSEPVGKIILNNSPDSLHIIDIAFIDSMRGKGYGTAILRALKNMANKLDFPIRLAVEQQNIRAKKLYLSLGFALIESSSTHDTLLW